MLVGGAFLADLLPRTLWQSRMRPPRCRRSSARVRSHWTRERVTLVVMGVVCFYITYVSYRNLKSFLPFVLSDKMYDRELHLLDRLLMFGHDPAVVMHDLLGTGFTAWVLSFIYLWFLPLVPLALTAWLVWSRNLTYGYWFAPRSASPGRWGRCPTTRCPRWARAFEYVAPYFSLADTPTSALMESLSNTRAAVMIGGVEGVVQSVAGFASLHCAITLLVALMVQFTLRSTVLKWVAWVNFGLTSSPPSTSAGTTSPTTSRAS